jgi:hypothetical protein
VSVPNPDSPAMEEPKALHLAEASALWGLVLVLGRIAVRLERPSEEEDKGAVSDIESDDSLASAQTDAPLSAEDATAIDVTYQQVASVASAAGDIPISCDILDIRPDNDAVM